MAARLMNAYGHICPSNIRWFKYENAPLYHLVPRAWQQDDPMRAPKRDDDMRSDGMFWNVFRPTTLCGVATADLGRVTHGTILMNEKDACPDCWKQRW